ncbi:38494_t:CDS:2 [Gigaspora margarita]|uniref:38494_t:CDS:1 n=1 Tax=Gigaspora margarita TaxID=4874 RepID=A0ABN7UEA7_GIGMA|nr:38494_t:CDS:2 [Gigaspora margarita]
MVHSQNTTSKSRSSPSFVWEYFRKEGITPTCEIIMGDWEECGALYNEDSTTSNLINHLVRKHKREDEQILFSGQPQSLLGTTLQQNTQTGEMLFLKRNMNFLDIIFPANE